MGTRRNRDEPAIPERPPAAKITAAQWSFLHKRILELERRTIEAVFINLPDEPAAVVAARKESVKLSGEINDLSMKRNRIEQVIRDWQQKAVRSPQRLRAVDRHGAGRRHHVSRLSAQGGTR